MKFVVAGNMTSIAPRAASVTSPLAEVTSSSSEQDVTTAAAAASPTTRDSRTVILEDIEVRVHPTPVHILLGMLLLDE